MRDKKPLSLYTNYLRSSHESDSLQDLWLVGNREVGRVQKCYFQGNLEQKSELYPPSGLHNLGKPLDHWVISTPSFSHKEFY